MSRPVVRRVRGTELQVLPSSVRWTLAIDQCCDHRVVALAEPALDGFIEQRLHQICARSVDPGLRRELERIGEVRLADNNGDYEVHMIPGKGNIDFDSCLNRLEDSGYRAHYSMAYGSPEEKIASRQHLASLVN